MRNMREESEKYPFKLVEQSTLMISPSFKTMSEDGIPWQTSSLMVWYHVALAFVQSQLLVKIVVAFFIFLPAAAPAGTVSVYDVHVNTPWISFFYIVPQE